MEKCVNTIGFYSVFKITDTSTHVSRYEVRGPTGCRRVSSLAEALSLATQLDREYSSKPELEPDSELDSDEEEYSSPRP